MRHFVIWHFLSESPLQPFWQKNANADESYIIHAEKIWKRLIAAPLLKRSKNLFSGLESSLLGGAKHWF
jgi:hypothetical protein